MQPGVPGPNCILMQLILRVSQCNNIKNSSLYFQMFKIYLIKCQVYFNMLIIHKSYMVQKWNISISNISLGGGLGLFIPCVL